MNIEHHWYSTAVRIPLGVGQYNNKYSTKSFGHLNEGVQQSPSCSLHKPLKIALLVSYPSTNGARIMMTTRDILFYDAFQTIPFQIEQTT